jgi:hypothetical protein
LASKLCGLGVLATTLLTLLLLVQFEVKITPSANFTLQHTPSLKALRSGRVSHNSLTALLTFCATYVNAQGVKEFKELMKECFTLYLLF